MFSVVEMRNYGCVTVLLSVSFYTDAYFSLFHLLYCDSEGNIEGGFLLATLAVI